MLNQNMPLEQRRGFHEWISQEWSRCSNLRGSFENHAVTYLMTTNGGGAAAVMAFAGSAGYATKSVYWTLAVFTLGLFFAGCAIITGYYRMAWLTKSLGMDHRAFNKGELRSSILEERHHQRFKRYGYGEWFGWLSFLLLVFGAISSAITFESFMAEKAAKAAKEERNEMKASSEPKQGASSNTVQPTPAQIIDSEPRQPANRQPGPSTTKP